MTVLLQVTLRMDFKNTFNLIEIYLHLFLEGKVFPRVVELSKQLLFTVPAGLGPEVSHPAETLPRTAAGTDPTPERPHSLSETGIPVLPDNNKHISHNFISFILFLLIIKPRHFIVRSVLLW